MKIHRKGEALVGLSFGAVLAIVLSMVLSTACKHSTLEPTEARKPGGAAINEEVSDMLSCSAAMLVALPDQGSLVLRDSPLAGASQAGSLANGAKVQVVTQQQGELHVDPRSARQSKLWVQVAERDCGQSVCDQAGWVNRLYLRCDASGGSGIVDVEPSCGDGAKPSTFVWPVPRERNLSQAYGRAIDYQECKFHTGIDVMGGLGDPIRAAAAGRVVHVGPMWARGAGAGRGEYAIIIQHAPNFYSTYGHNRRALVRRGDCVYAGQTIAELGDEGYSDFPHLHFELIANRSFTGNWQWPFYSVCVIREPYAANSGYISPNPQAVRYRY